MLGRMQYALLFSFLGTFYRCPLAAPLASDAQSLSDDGAVGEDRCDGCGVRQTGDDHQHVSWSKNGSREEKESRAATYVCLEVGEIGWSVWAAEAWCLWVGKESTC